MNILKKVFQLIKNNNKLLNQSDYIDGASISISLEKLSQNNTEEANKLGALLENIGVVKLDHNISSSFIEKTWKITEEIFKIPYQETENHFFSDRDKATIPEDANVRGLMITGKQLLETVDEKKENTNTFFKRSWIFTESLPNIYPPVESVPEAKEIINQNIKQFRMMSDVVQKNLAKYLGDTENRLINVTSHQNSFADNLFLLMDYPVIPQEALGKFKNNQLFYRCSEHYDKCMMLIFLMVRNPSGLQVNVPVSDPSSAKWVDIVNDEPYSIYAFLGDRASLLTNGRLKPLPHRVVGNNKQMQQQRQSITYVCRPDPLKDWFNLASGELIKYKEKPLSPGAWYSLLHHYEKATISDLNNYTHLRYEGLNELKEYIYSLENS